MNTCRASLALPLLAFACSHPDRTPDNPVAPAATPTEESPEDVAVLEDALASNAILVFGDTHGTQEIPQFVGRVVDTIARRKPVVLAMEIPHEQDAALARFVRGPGDAAAREALLKEPFWQAEYQDGRRSTAMLALIESIRVLRAGGANVDLFAFDVEAGPGVSDRARDRGMADKILALRSRRPDAAIVAYVGSLHAVRGSVDFDPDKRWMARWLIDAGVPVVSLAPRHREGSAWICTDADASHCGPKRLGTRDDHTPGIHLDPTPDGNFDGYFGVGTVSAAAPATAPERSTVVVEDPADRHRTAAIAAYEKRDFRDCAAAFARIDAPAADDAYSHACCLALAGDHDAAFERLEHAREIGYSDTAHMLADPDLLPLHEDPRWPVSD